jgi:hypothetical protein
MAKKVFSLLFFSTLYNRPCENKITTFKLTPLASQPTSSAGLAFNSIVTAANPIKQDGQVWIAALQSHCQNLSSHESSILIFTYITQA